MKKDRYGGIAVGLAVEKPTKGGKVLYSKTIDQIYKRSIAQAIGNAVYENFETEEVEVNGKPCAQLAVVVIPVDKYERLVRKANKVNKSAKLSKVQ